MENEEKKVLESERESALHQVEDFMERPMYLLAFLWLVLTIVDFTSGLSRILNHTMTFIWIIFWIDFLLKFTLAAKKQLYLKKNWLTLLALAVPALRLFRALRAVRFVQLFRGTRIIRVLGSFNRSMRSLNTSLGRKGFRYVIGLTLIVIMLGGAAIYTLEKNHSDYFEDYGVALWWSSMMITTMGSDYFPKSSEGRILALLLAIYGFAVFGYVTATVASFFIDQDASSVESEVASETEIKKLRAELKAMNESMNEIKEFLSRK